MCVIPNWLAKSSYIKNGLLDKVNKIDGKVKKKLYNAVVYRHFVHNLGPGWISCLKDGRREAIAAWNLAGKPCSKKEAIWFYRYVVNIRHQKELVSEKFNSYTYIGNNCNCPDCKSKRIVYQ